MSDVQGRPTGTMSNERRYGIAISIALILGGVYWALTGLTEGEQSSADNYPVEGNALVVKNASAEIEIRPGDGTDVHVERQFKRNALGHPPKEKYDNGKLELNAGGCGFLSFGCKTTYVLTVPRDVDLTVETSSGRVTVAGMTGGVKVKASSGDIEAHELGGPVRLETSSGDISADGLTATDVTSKTSSGDQDLDFAVAPQSVQAKASSGDVQIQVPTGDATYKTDIDTSSGDNNTNVTVDPTSARTIQVKTSSGDVQVDYNHQQGNHPR